MPIKKTDYPMDWKAISLKVRAQAGNVCELCRVPNGELIVRIPDHPYPWQLVENCGDGHYYPKLTKVILTVHHIDGNRRNNSKHNLIALCQRCHLRLDREKHIKHRKARRGGYQESLPL